MKINVRVTNSFKIAAKPLFKKFPSLIDDLEKLEEELIKNPQTGVPLGANAYKIRLQIKSKGKGKSGGARVITFLETEILGEITSSKEEITVNLITIYDKSEIAAISNKELKMLISSIRKNN